jgi:hypothetical protein
MANVRKRQIPEESTAAVRSWKIFVTELSLRFILAQTQHSHILPGCFEKNSFLYSHGAKNHGSQKAAA